MPEWKLPWNRNRRPMGPRTSGYPTSSNGASSLHLGWDTHGPLEVVSVSLTVIEAPAVDALYFWALQTDFVDQRGRPAGGAHVGLQWHPGFPGRTAVNWGGYRHGGGELDGSGSQLPSAAGNRNTRNYPWEPGRTYRLTVRPLRSEEAPLDPAPAGAMRAWRATITDTSRDTAGASPSNTPAGKETVIRDLHVPAVAVGNVTVWSEVFARCDDPTASVVWSDPTVTTRGGESTSPTRARVNYQSERDGGCANSNSAPVTAPNAGIVQSTNTGRSTAQGSVIAWPGP